MICDLTNNHLLKSNNIILQINNKNMSSTNNILQYEITQRDKDLQEIMSLLSDKLFTMNYLVTEESKLQLEDVFKS